MKRIYALVCCLLIAGSVFAETKPRFGVIGGLTTTSTKFSTAIADIKGGSFNQFHVGICYNQPLILGFAIQPGLEYNVKGVQFSQLEGIKDINFKTGYLELPVQVQWGLDLLGVLRPYVFAEPFIGFALNNTANSANISAKGWDYLKSRFEGGLGVGAGIDIFRHVQVSFRYFWNLGEIYKLDVTNLGTISSGNCQGFKVSAAILF